MPGASPQLRPLWLIAVATSLLVALMLPGLVPKVPSAAAAPVSVVKVLGWGFDFPSAIAGDAHHLYVANLGGDTVDVLGLANGSLDSGPTNEVRIWYGPQHNFSHPTAVALYGGTLWVLSSGLDPYLSAHHRITLTALDAATGRAEHVVTAYYSGGLPASISSFDGLSGALAIDGPDLFVSDPGGNKVIELGASNGRRVRVLDGPQYDFGAPSALATIGPDLFVANTTGQMSGSVTEVDARTGALVQVISGKQFHFARPDALAAWGSNLFVVNAGKAASANSDSTPPGSVTELATYASGGAPPTTTTTAPPTSTTTTTSTTSTTPTTTTTIGTTTTSIAPSTTTSSGPVPTTSVPVGRTTTTIAATTTTLTATSITTTTPLPTTPPGATLVRVISGPKLHLVQPQAAAVSNGQLFVATDPGGPGAVVVIDAATGAPAEVLNRPSCQFADPLLVEAEGRSVFVASYVGGVTQLRSGRCVAAVDGSAYGLHFPGTSTVAGGELFVANSLWGPSLTGSITELNASTGALTRIIAQPGGQLGGYVTAVAAGGKRLYVVGAFGDVVVVDARTGAVKRHFNLPFGDLATGAVLKGATLYISVVQGGLLALNTITGHLRRVVGPPPSDFGSFALFGLPPPMVLCGDDLFYLWVDQTGKALVKEVDMATGKVVRDISGPSYHLDASSQMVVWGKDIFVTGPALPAGTGLAALLNPGPGALTEIDATTGAILRRISGARYDFQEPEGISVGGDDLFVADSAADAVTDVDASTGRLVSVMSGARYQFDSPEGLAVYGGHLFAVNQSGDSVTDIDLGP